MPRPSEISVQIKGAFFFLNTFPYCPFWKLLSFLCYFHYLSLVLSTLFSSQSHSSQSNNPIGGLGLTTGLLDAACLGNCLIRILTKKEPDTLLTQYAETRRKAWLTVTDPESTAFKHRLSSTEPQHIKDREGFFYALNNDPNVYTHIANSMNEVLEDLEA